MKISFQLLIVLFVVAISHSCFAQASTYGNNTKAGKYMVVKGVKLYYEVYGRGKPLLLLHGNGGSIGAFKKNVPFFSKEYQVIAVDSRAQGKSIDKGDSLSFEMMADDFAVLLKQLKIDSCYVIGWSDGGITGIIMAMRYPQLVKKIAVTGANIFADSTAFTPALYQQLQTGYKENKDKNFSDPTLKNDWKLFLLDVFQPHLSFTDLSSIKCSSLIISGDKDVIRLEHTIKIYQSIPKAQLWVLPNSGHGTLVDYADEFNQKVDQFFKQR